MQRKHFYDNKNAEDHCKHSFLTANFLFCAIRLAARNAGDQCKHFNKKFLLKLTVR